MGKETAFRVPEPDVTHLSLSGRVLAFAAGSALSKGMSEHAEWMDTKTGARHVFARTATAGGQIDWVEASGPLIVYTDQARVQDDIDQRSAWRLCMFDRISGRTTVIASSIGRGDAYIPLPRAVYPDVVWDQLGAGGTSLKTKLYDARTAVTVVVRARSFSTGTSLARGYLVYDQPSGHGRDVVQAPLSSPSHGSPVSSAHKDFRARVSPQGTIVWQEPTTGDPTSLWESHVGATGRPALLFTGPNLGNATPGVGFTAWFDPNGGLMVGDPGRSAVQAAAVASVAPRIAADGHVLAWGTTDAVGTPAETTSIHLVTVSRA